MRAPGMTLHKVPLFVWAIFVTAILLLLSLPVLAGDPLGFALALNSANCWELLYYLRQSAGNLLDLDLLGIFRDYTPEFTCYLNLPISCSIIAIGNNPLNDKNPSPSLHTVAEPGRLCHCHREKGVNFSYYLAGLIEGDGTIIVPKTERSDKGKLNYPSIQIVFHLKDLPLALLIQKNLGHGSLARKKGVNAYILTINNLEGLVLLVNLINGKLRTPKFYSFCNLINWLKIKKLILDLDFTKHLDNSSLISSAWLSGFIEADGHFSVRASKKSLYPNPPSALGLVFEENLADSVRERVKVDCTFELVQRQTDHNGKNNLYFLEEMASFLLTSAKSIRMDKPKPQYRVRTTSLKGNIALENYLTLFPLFGTKYLDYKDWVTVLNLFKLGEHKNKLGKEKIISIKSNMNDSRTIFVWDHLQNFYNLDK